MQIITASTTPPSQSSTNPDDTEPSKTPGDAGDATATTPRDTSHTPGEGGDASATAQSHNSLTPKAPSSPQASTDPGQVSNENNGSKGTSTGTGVPALNAQGVATSSANPASATTPVSSVGQPTVAVPSVSTQSTTPGLITQAPNIAATTPKTARTWAPWSLLSGIFPNRLTTSPPPITPITTPPASPPTTQASVVNNPMQTLSLPSGNAVALPVTTAGGNQLQKYPKTTTSVKTVKRKRHQASALSIMRQKRIRPTIIDDKVALSILKELKMTRGFLDQGKILAWALQPDDIDFSNIYDYVGRSQHDRYGIKILSIIRVIPRANALQEDDGPAVSFSNDPNVVGKQRKMLWHGTRQRYMASILENGLRLPKVERGGYFGNGIYFADRIPKSLDYCDSDYQDETYGSTFYLLLCDVLLGEVYETEDIIPNLRKAPQHHVPGRGMVDCDSVKGCGRRVPDEGWNMEIDGCIWPLGFTVQNSGSDALRFLDYNEFIVYDTKQVQPKYVLKVEHVKNPILETIY